jgi:hypothetical protein
VSQIGRSIGDSCNHCRGNAGGGGRLKPVFLDNYQGMTGGFRVESTPIVKRVIGFLACDNPECGSLFAARAGGEMLVDYLTQQIENGFENPATKPTNCSSCQTALETMMVEKNSQTWAEHFYVWCGNCYKICWHGWQPYG